MHFTRINQTPFTIQETNYTEVLESFPDSQIYPFFADRPLERKCPLQLGPQGATAGGDVGIRRTAEDHMQKGFEWWPEMGRGQRRRARTADSGSGGRRSGCSGTCSAET
jgi:hypothetical protein